MSRSKSKYARVRSPRRGRLAVTAVIAIAVIGILSFVGWYAWGTFQTGPKADPSVAVAAQRGTFIHEITAQGSLESANNIEVRCMVQSSSGAITILSLVPEGTYVQEGDILAELDKSRLEQDLVQQQITCNGSQASVIQAQATYDTAVLAKKEYVGELDAVEGGASDPATTAAVGAMLDSAGSGTYRQAELTIRNKIAAAQEDQRRASEKVKYSKRLLARGYITPLQVEADQFAEDQAGRALEIAQTELAVLQNFTRRKVLTQLQSDIDAAKAKLEAQKHTHDLDMQKLDYIRKQIENCTIRAPAAGQIIYKQEQSFRGGTNILIEQGATVRERQVLFMLPDPTKMQVACRVNETHVALVRREMPARIRVDALPDVEFQGKVTDVNEYPEPANFLSSTIKDYKTIVTILNAREGMRPGLTAEVRILVNRQEDVIMVPVQCVFEHGGRTFCILYDDNPKNWKAVQVEVGPTNDKQIVIHSGLAEGTQVVQGASRHRDRVALPEFTEEELRANAEASEERNAAPSIPTPAPGGDVRPSGPPSPASLISRFDRNGNGALEPDELPGPLQEYFATLDKNSDGSLDASELAAGMAALGGAMGGGRPPGAGPDGGAPGAGSAFGPAGGGIGPDGGSPGRGPAGGPR